MSQAKQPSIIWVGAIAMACMPLANSYADNDSQAVNLPAPVMTQPTVAEPHDTLASSVLIDMSHVDTDQYAWCQPSDDPALVTVAEEVTGEATEGDLPDLPSATSSLTETDDDTASTNEDGDTDQSGVSLAKNDRFKLNGFISTGVSQTNADNDAGYNIAEHGQVTDNPSFDANTLLGLQLSAFLNEQFSVVGQFVASGDDTNGNSAYDVDATWAFLQYKPVDNVKIDLGRMRMPLYLYSNTIQVGYTNPYLFLPNEVYRIVPFYNMNGISTIYQRPFGSSGWTLQTQPFFGQDSSQYDVISGNGDTQLTDYDENNLVGSAVTISNAAMTFRGSYAHLDLTATNNASGDTLFTDGNTSFYSFGTKINLKQLLFSAEYAHRDVPKGVAELTGFYATIGVQLQKFLPTFTYAHLKTDNQDQLDDNDEAAEAQESFTLAMAYYLTDHIDLKASVADIHLMDGTNGMFSKDPGKANVWLYGFGVDAIF